jgi:hypothetical protein
MRRFWARAVAKLEDNHARRTVMANARANAARDVELALTRYEVWHNGALIRTTSDPTAAAILEARGYHLLVVTTRSESERG